MTKTLAIIHTGPVLVNMLTTLAKEIMPQVKIRNIMDDSLLPDCLAAGNMTHDVARRIGGYMLHAEQHGADVILLSCSSVSPAADLARPLLRVPVLKIDDPMAEEAVRRGNRIALVATVPTTLDPSEGLIRQKAASAQKSITVKRFLCDRAFSALLAGDIKEHNRILMQTIEQASVEYDVVVLAQGSMSNIVPELPERIRVKVLTSPRLGMERAWELLRTMSKTD